MVNNSDKYIRLRNEFPVFVYEGHTITDNDESLSITFHFNLSNQFSLRPVLRLKKGHQLQKKLSASVIENFVFHIGLIELISYWKSSCAPTIIIKPYRLSNTRVQWWKNLWYHGLGEFFYVNQIQAGKEDFVNVITGSGQELLPVKLDQDDTKMLVPVGGGKDSAVTLELLRDHFNCVPFIMNPRNASLGTAEKAGFDPDSVIIVERTLDPELLRLNEQGFLNGHTPFSALLAFVSILAAGLSGAKYIALSNESSANEPTDNLTGVNHQYSKSYDFERDFRNYVRTWITNDIEYSSFLRPLNEIGIARIFSRFTKYHPVFKSCNVGSKSDRWCGSCAKCLFTFIILSPYLERDSLVKIFGKNLLDDPNLSDLFDELTGQSGIKPFECIGTVDEVNESVCRTISGYKGKLPFLLQHYSQSQAFTRYKNLRIGDNAWDSNNFLTEKMVTILKNAVSE